MQYLVLLSLISAVALALTNIIIKKFSPRLDEYILSWSKYFFALPLLWIALIFDGIPTIQPVFWLIIVGMMPFEIAITLLITKALKGSDASKIIPFTAFTPLFAALFATITLGEALSWWMIAALSLLILGAYLINLDYRQGYLAPFKAATKDKGILFIIISSILIGWTVVLGKTAILASSPIFFTAVYFLLFTLLFSPYLLRKSTSTRVARNYVKPLLLIGTANSIFFLTGWMATKYGPVAVANAVSTTNVLFTLLFAGLFLKEKGLLRRLVASGVMLLGTVMVILYS